jgi:hypothetical protein
MNEFFIPPRQRKQPLEQKIQLEHEMPTKHLINEVQYRPQKYKQLTNSLTKQTPAIQLYIQFQSIQLRLYNCPKSKPSSNLQTTKLHNSTICSPKVKQQSLLKNCSPLQTCCSPTNKKLTFRTR